MPSPLLPPEPLPTDNAKRLVMNPREQALYAAGEAIGIAKTQRAAAQMLADLASQLRTDPAAVQLTAWLDDAEKKAQANAKNRELAGGRKPKGLTWAQLATGLAAVKNQPVQRAAQVAELLDKGVQQLNAQALQGDQVFAAKLAEVSGYTIEEVKAKPGWIRSMVQVFLTELVKGAR